MAETLETELDLAMKAMAGDTSNDALRLAFHGELSRAELFVLLEEEVAGGTMTPRVFEVSDGNAVLAFDSEMRLADFAGTAAAYAALPGRVLVTMLADENTELSLVINPDVDHAAFLPPEALRWLAQTLSGPAPQEDAGVIAGMGAPQFPAAVATLLLPALERRLSGVPGVDAVALVQVTWASGGTGHVLAISGLPTDAQAPVARAVSEALTLSGLEAAALDVVFPSAAEFVHFQEKGLSLSVKPFEMPREQTLTPGANPGMDPQSPPKLR